MSAEFSAVRFPAAPHLITCVQRGVGVATLEPAKTPWGRFGVETLVDGPDPFVAAMPLAGLHNPVNRSPTLAPLAVLVDFAAGVVNFYRRTAGEWIVSSELSIEFCPDALATVAAAPDEPVVATARPFGAKASTSASTCELAHRGTVIGTAAVRCVHITPLGGLPEDPDLRSGGAHPVELAEIMALRVADPDGATPLIYQNPEASLNNPLGVVHGGVAAAGLELAASAALNPGDPAVPLQTASLRVNFLRQFLAGPQSRYLAEVSRVGRRSGICDATAIGDDGELAITARITAYR